MSDTPTQTPPPPIDAETAEALAVAKKLVRAWHGCKAGGGYVGRALRAVDRWSGPVALALVLLGFQGCHLSLPVIPWHFPWPIPTPVPPAPIPGNGLYALIVYDAAKTLPASQQAIIDGADVRGYLQAHCAPGTDGKTKEFRILPASTDMANESPLWQTAMKRQRSGLPWLVVSNGKTGFEGPLPATVAEAMALLQKYGGN